MTCQGCEAPAEIGAAWCADCRLALGPAFDVTGNGPVIAAGAEPGIPSVAFVSGSVPAAPVFEVAVALALGALAVGLAWWGVLR